MWHSRMLYTEDSKHFCIEEVILSTLENLSYAYIMLVEIFCNRIFLSHKSITFKIIHPNLLSTIIKIFGFYFRV